MSALVKDCNYYQIICELGPKSGTDNIDRLKIGCPSSKYNNFFRHQIKALQLTFL